MHDADVAGAEPLIFWLHCMPSSSPLHLSSSRASQDPLRSNISAMVTRSISLDALAGGAMDNVDPGHAQSSNNLVVP